MRRRLIGVLGATGYTGRLVARALSEQGLPLLLAGRSTARLDQLAASLPVRPPCVTIDVRDPQTLQALAGIRLLINCAGPFTDLGVPVVAYAVREGLVYIDITNETGFVHDVYSRFGELARARGATIVPACGFEVALSDCAAALLAARLPAGTLDEVSVVYQIPGLGSSYGTRASALRSLATSWLTYEEGALIAARPCVSATTVQIGMRRLHTLSFPSSELLTIPAHLCVRSVRTAMAVTRPGRFYGPRLIPALIPLLSGPAGWGLRLFARLASRPPDARRRERRPFSLLVTARMGQEQASVVLEGLDPYGLTAKIVAFAAGIMAEREQPAGVLPPALVLPPAALLAALEGWGVRIRFGNSLSAERTELMES